jgi:hypothetical protein
VLGAKLRPGALVAMGLGDGPALVDAVLPVDYWAMLREPESGRLTGTHAVPTVRDTRRWLESRADQYDRADSAVLNAATGAFVGEVVLNEFSADDASANLRIHSAAVRPATVRHSRPHTTDAIIHCLPAVPPMELRRIRIAIRERYRHS